MPVDPVFTTIRPLNKGMVRNLAPTGMEPGSFWNAQNYMVGINGPKRRPGFIRLMGGNQVAAADRPLVDIAAFWKTDGTQEAGLITSRYFYQFKTYSAPTVKNWTCSEGTCSTSGSTVTGSGTNWDSDDPNGWIRAGDYIVLDADGSGDGPETIEISAVTNDTTLALASTPVGTYGAGTDYEIHRGFVVDDDYLVDWVVVAGDTNKLIMSDYSRPPYSYDGTDFTTLDDDIAYIPACVAYFGGSRSDRLWLLNTKEGTYGSELNYFQRIRWSSATDVTDFAAADYIDLPYGNTPIKKGLNLGYTFVIYLGDAIFYGRPANDPNLPYVFDRLGTDGVGLIGPKAVVSYLNGHFFVGQDNIYFLGSDLSVERIGTPIVEQTIHACDSMNKIYVAIDTVRDQILFGFPESGDSIEKIWHFNYKAKAWSYTERVATFLSNPLIDIGLTWDDLGTALSANTWTGLGADFESWDQIGEEQASNKIYTSQSGYIYELSENRSNDQVGGLIEAELETGDFDFGKPDIDKTMKRLTVRLEDNPSGDLTFNVFISDDGGDSWTDVGDLVIASTERKGKLDFTATGGILRPKLTSDSDVEPYVITEIGMKVVPRGEEIRYD